MPADDPEPPQSPHPLSTQARQNWRIPRVSLPLLTSFAFLALFAFLITFLILPAKPDRSWIASTARNMIWFGIFVIAGCLASGAIYRLNAWVRAIVRRFRFMRVELGTIVIMQPPALIFLAYGIALHQNSALWNRLIFALLGGPLVAGVVFLVVAQLAGQLAAKEIREYLEQQGHLERPSNTSSQPTQPPDPIP